MSSGMNELNNNNNAGVTGSVQEQDVVHNNCTTTENIQDRYKDGFKTADDFNTYIEHLQTIQEFSLDHLLPSLNTTDPEILTSIGASAVIGKKIKEALDILKEQWNADSLKLLLNLLDHVPFDLRLLKYNELGYAVQDIKKIALENNSIDITNMAVSLIDKWKALRSESVKLNGPTKRDSPERSSTSPPQSPTKRLALSKDRPAKASAKYDPYLISSLSQQQPKRVPRVLNRPIYGSSTENEPVAGNAYNTVTASTPNNISSTTTTKSGKPKKSVTFSKELVTVREYEKNPEEWTNFEVNQGAYVAHQYGNARDMDIREGQGAFVHTIPWYTPYQITFSLERNPDLIVPKQIETDQSVIQDKREKTSLAVFYTSVQHIPASPAEPDEIPDANTNGAVDIIPLFEVEAAVTANQQGPDDYHQEAAPVLATPQPLIDINALSAVISKLVPNSPQQQQLQAPPVVPPQHAVQQQNRWSAPVNKNYQQPQQQQKPPPVISQQHAVQQRNRWSAPVNTNYQQPQPQPQQQQNNYYSSYGSAQGNGYVANNPTHNKQDATMVHQHQQPAQQQPKITNQSIEDMLRDNPGIMQSLKQLSFLAAGSNLAPELPSPTTTQHYDIPNNQMNYDASPNQSQVPYGGGYSHGNGNDTKGNTHKNNIKNNKPINNKTERGGMRGGKRGRGINNNLKRGNRGGRGGGRGGRGRGHLRGGRVPQVD